jgi:hypothetical protein
MLNQVIDLISFEPSIARGKPVPTRKPPRLKNLFGNSEAKRSTASSIENTFVEHMPTQRFAAMNRLGRDWAPEPSPYVTYWLREESDRNRP